MWKLSIEDDQGNKTVVNLVRDEYTVGRGDQNTVRLTERNISRRHAVLEKNGSGWVLRDVSSYNGCFVNGVRVSDHQAIDHGDLVQLGDYRLVVMDDELAQSTDKASTAPSVPRSQALLGQPDRLVMLVGPTPGAEFPLAAERLTIGRGEECDISINHGSVSRVHAEIHSLGDGRYEIIDKGSANGVRINGVDLKQSLIDARDIIELGDVQLKFIPQGVVYALGVEESQRIEGYADGRASVAAVVGPGAPSLVAPVKVALGVLGLGILVLLGMLLFGRGTVEAPVETTVGADHAKTVLEEARSMAQRGDLEGAHERLGRIPEDSNLRKSTEFRDVEAQWADALFRAAEAAATPAEKRRVLDRIAKATTLDHGRRKLAADQIASLDGEGVDPSELESAATAHQPQDPSLKDGLVRRNPFGDPAPEPPPAAGPRAPGPSPAAPRAPAPQPQAPSAKDLAQSGDRANAARAKAIYEAKANSGRATMEDLRMLRALCGQLGDAGCRARASALMAQKKAQGGN